MKINEETFKMLLDRISHLEGRIQSLEHKTLVMEGSLNASR